MGSILLVESDQDTRDQLGSAMREAGHEVLTALNVREAFLRISEGGIDVVVVDAYDPRVGMVELSRSMNTLPDAPPVLLVSASPHAPEISARVGAAAFIPKPCEPSEVVAAVTRIAGDVRPTRVIDDTSVPTDMNDMSELNDFAMDEEPTGPARQFG
ncbi:MAG: response regulator [Kofleriaceae bacterium]|nr:response regulator [Kofleriaceae bacterium]